MEKKKSDKERLTFKEVITHISVFFESKGGGTLHEKLP